MTNEQQPQVGPSPALESDVPHKPRRGRPRKIPVSTPQTARVLMKTLFAHFGNEGEALRLARAFAGMTVSFPNPDMVERLVRDDRIFAALQREPSTAVVRRLCDSFHVSGKTVAVAFRAANGGIGLQGVRAKMKAGAVEDGQPDVADGNDVHQRAAPDSSKPSV